MIETRIARRYLWSARKRAHTAFLSSISMLGLAVGVATLLISLALMAGLQGQIKRRLIASSPQLLIEPAGSPTIADADAIAAAGKRLGMTRRSSARQRHRLGRERPAAARTSDAPSLRRPASSSRTATSPSRAISPPRCRSTSAKPSPSSRRARASRRSVRCRSGASTGSPAFLPRRATSSRADALLNLGETESLFGTGGKPTSIEMYGHEDRAEEIQAQLANQFPGVQVKTWKEINRPLFLALRLEKIVMFVTISLIIFVAALNLISSLSMLILEKRPSVGVLRTLGATERTILIDLPRSRPAHRPLRHAPRQRLRPQRLVGGQSLPPRAAAAPASTRSPTCR